ncbi:MAG: hypothetical protein GC191_19735 [Azospirillum sp.]|nr:hypothetical protein [Azospirillum sp.]
MNALQQRASAHDRIAVLLDDPIVELVMCRDGLTRDGVYAAMSDMRLRLRHRQSLYNEPRQSAA